MRRHFSFFHEHLSRCKYCSEAYSTLEGVVQHCATSHRMCIPSPQVIKRIQRSIPYMELAAFWSSGFGEDLKGFLPYLGMAASWSQDNEVSEYDQEIKLS